MHLTTKVGGFEKTRVAVVCICGAVCSSGLIRAQTAEPFTDTQSKYVTPADETSTITPPSIDEKWDNFIHETVAWYTLGAGGFNATVSQLARSAPHYGRHWDAYPERFGASVADIATQNFFGDFVLASAFHEDTRYVRRGPTHHLLPRIGYALSRAVIVRRDAGGDTFNFANVLGTGMSAGLSNAYYPARSRSLHETFANWGSTVGASGLVNLMPEFWPDFSGWLKRHNPLRHRSG